MFKNKRNFSIIAIALIVIIGLSYAGCSKSTDMQTTPNLGTESSVKSCSSSIANEPEYAIVDGYNYLLEAEDLEGDFTPLNPGKHHFLEKLIESIESDIVQFDTEQHRNAYLNKIYATINQIQEESFTGAQKKIENDLIPHCNSWVIDNEYKEAALSKLEMTHFIVTHPDYEVALDSSSEKENADKGKLVIELKCHFVLVYGVPILYCELSVKYVAEKK